MISCNTRQTGSLVRGNLALTSSDCQTGYVDTLLQMLCPPNRHSVEPLLKDTPEIRDTWLISLRVETFHCSLASQTHLYNKKEGSGELCIQTIYPALYVVVQSCCSTLAHDTLQRFSCNNRPKISFSLYCRSYKTC